MDKTADDFNNTVDEMNDFLNPIIADLTKQVVKYNELNTDTVLDPNKMTIVQRNEYEKYQKEKKKIFKKI